MADMRGEIYRNWLVIPIEVEETYYYEIHSPEGYRNFHLKPFESPEDAIAWGCQEIDRLIEILYETA